MIFAGDAALFYAALGAALLVRGLAPVSAGVFLEHAAVFSFFLPVWALVFYAAGFYDLRRLNRLVTLLHLLLAGLAVNSAAAVAVFYLFSPQLGLTPKTHLFLTLVFFHALAALWRRLWTGVFFPRLLAQRVAFVGADPLLEEIKAFLAAHPHLGFRAAAAPGMEMPPAGAGADWRPRGRRPGPGPDLIVVAADYADKTPALRNQLLSGAALAEIPVVTHLDFYEELYGKIPPEHASRTDWLLANVLGRKNRVYARVKRGLDLALALAVLVPALPCMLLTWLALRAEGRRRAAAPWPAFFFQKRVGYLGRRFILWKFRTMAPGAHRAGPFSGGPGDARVTRLGRFLRNTRLDELPQLWNILKGDMSIVGPRPEWIQEVRILERAVPHYHLRHLVKPGATGWAQINYGATAGERGSLEKLHYDLYYVKNISLALDLGIILRTFQRVFRNDASFLADQAPGGAAPRSVNSVNSGT